jgi:sirohydrochlorin ferrochelatase
MMEPAGSPSLDMVTAALRADSSDIAIYARVLTESLGDALPPDNIQVDRATSMSDRLKGRAGKVSKITIRLGDQVLTLRLTDGAPVAEVCREVRGVVLSRQPVSVGQWAAELARALVTHAEQNAATADALRRLVAGGPPP